MSTSAFKLALSPEFLEDLVQNKMKQMTFAPEAAYEDLTGGDKEALAHLVKASVILDDVFLKQDHPDNIQAKAVLKARAQKGDKHAADALTLLTILNGIEGYDRYAPTTKPLRLFEEKVLAPGKAFYPQDLSQEELAAYIATHPEDAAALFSHNTIVKRAGKRLVGKPYSVAFRSEMGRAARELLAAARATTHDGLRSYLRWQAQALVNDSDPEPVYKADCAWAALNDSPIEFTLSRECYDDRMTSLVTGIPAVAAVLKENGIQAKPKDMIGVRVGLPNKKSLSRIALFRKHLDAFAALMPLREQYSLVSAAEAQNALSFIDVDLVSLTGDYASLRSGITSAQNLPNDDKLAVKLGLGGRLVFHRDVRQIIDPVHHKKFLKALVAPSQQGAYDPDSYFSFLLGHEAGHSFGPQTTRDGREKLASLGGMGNILEENKADMAALTMADYLAKAGAMTAGEITSYYVTWATGLLPDKKPALDVAHDMRRVMQLNYYRRKGALLLEKGDRLQVVEGKMAPTTRQMLAEVIGLQLDGDAEKAKAFVERYGAWDEALQQVADKQLALKPRRYLLLRQTLRDRLLRL